MIFILSFLLCIINDHRRPRGQDFKNADYAFAFGNAFVFDNADDAFAFDNALYSTMLMMHLHLTMHTFDNALVFGIDHAFMQHFDHALRGCPCINVEDAHVFQVVHAFA